MKLTNAQLKQIIKEELEAILEQKPTEGALRIAGEIKLSGLSGEPSEFYLQGTSEFGQLKGNFLSTLFRGDPLVKSLLKLYENPRDEEALNMFGNAFSYLAEKDYATKIPAEELKAAFLTNSIRLLTPDSWQNKEKLAAQNKMGRVASSRTQYSTRGAPDQF